MPSFFVWDTERLNGPTKRSSNGKTGRKLSGGSRSFVVKKSKERLLDSGFTEEEIETSFSANLREDMNTVVDNIEMRTMIFLLKNMQIKPLYRQALEKVFEFVCGEPIEKVDPQSNRLITNTFEVSKWNWAGQSHLTTRLRGSSRSWTLYSKTTATRTLGTGAERIWSSVAPRWDFRFHIFAVGGAVCDP